MKYKIGTRIIIISGTIPEEVMNQQGTIACYYKANFRAESYDSYLIKMDNDKFNDIRDYMPGDNHIGAILGRILYDHNLRVVDFKILNQEDD